MPARIRRIYDASARRLSRVTTSGRHIRELDGLRFVAIASVFVQHVYHVLVEHHPAWAAGPRGLGAELVNRCRFGVELFFLISGFILGLPFAGQHLLGGRPVSLRQYYWRRVTRLEPPYVLTLLLWYAVLVFYWHRPAGPLLPHLLASLGYVHNLVYRQFSTVNSVAWSLEIEVQFYLLAPLLAGVFRIRSAPLRRGAIVGAAVAVQQAFKLLRHAPTLAAIGGVGGTLLNALPLFLMGFLLADVYLTRWRQEPRASWWGDAVAVSGWLLLPLYFLPAAQARLPQSLLPYLLLVLCWASFRSVGVRWLLGSAIPMTIGGMCYSIYLLHYPLIEILGNYSRPTLAGDGLGANIVAFTLIWGAPVMAASILFFLAVEKPCMRRDWPARMLAWTRGRPPAADEPLADGVAVPARETAPLASNQPVP